MMRSMNELMVKAQRELAQLRKELDDIDARRQEVQSRIMKLQMFFRVSEDLGYVDESHLKKGYTKHFPSLPPLPGLADLQSKTQKERITDYCAKVLGIGFPMKTSELLRELEDAEIEVGGANKLLTISALLSKDDRFVPSRKDGWSLKQ